MRYFCFCFAFLASGCIYSALPKEQPNPPQILSSEQLEGHSYVIVEHFEALHCKRMLWDPNSTEENGIRRLIAMTGGYNIDALTNLRCEHGIVSALAKDCWSQMRCEADGIRFEKGHEG